MARASPAIDLSARRKATATRIDERRLVPDREIMVDPRAEEAFEMNYVKPPFPRVSIVINRQSCVEEK